MNVPFKSIEWALSSNKNTWEDKNLQKLKSKSLAKKLDNEVALK